MELKEKVWQQIDSLSDSLWDLALRIHEAPELPFEEYKAAAWLSETLKQAGFEVEQGVGGLPTAFRAIHPVERVGPRVAILAEYDAIPELGHACGHNLIAAIAVGASLGLAPFKEGLPGSLVVLGTPAEEGGGGKIILLEAGLFQDVDVAMMIHPGDQTWAKREYLALTEVEISFQGKAAHASSEPGKGVNALDAVIQTFVSINAFRPCIKDGACIYGIITDGGQKPNTIPEHAAGRFQIRTRENEYCEVLLGKLCRCAEGAALATGAELSFRKVGHPYEAMAANNGLARDFARHIGDLGYPVEEPTGGMASTDMGNVSWEVPVLHPHIGITDVPTALHSRAFAEASRSELARPAMLAAAKALAAICLDLWTDPNFYQEVKEEFMHLQRTPVQESRLDLAE
ncbi:M20 family metallopeptidase [Candidatus Bipolaricaulota bacterium]|nr:M20 family metallopeptidase [Candidatus Bipolaricaulota bacterium]